MYHRSYTNGNARYDIMSIMQNEYKHININVVDASLSDGSYLYPTLEYPPTSSTSILALARCDDGTVTDALINLSTNGDIKLSLYHYSAKTVTGIIASGFYN